MYCLILLVGLLFNTGNAVLNSNIYKQYEIM